MLGRTISNYEVVEKLGEGGMGVVCRARDLRLGRWVALKFLPHDFGADPQRVARFRKEARAISALNHPHVAIIHGIEEAGGSLFLVLEYLPGGSLRQRLQTQKAAGERISFSQAIDWIIQIAEGLAYAHRHGVVHRDIKPSNLLFSEEGAIKISDFGLAKMSDALAASGTGADNSGVVGTPHWMSPEQGRGLAVDGRGDIFSLGIVLFELIASELPFQADNPAALLHKIVHEAAPPLVQFRAGVPAGLQACVSKMLEKDPQVRYQTMDDVAAALRALESASTRREEAPTATLPMRAPARDARRWWYGMAIAALVLALAAIGWLATRARPIPAQKRIAVLLFTNVGGDAKNQALADGLMEVVSSSLTNLEQFQGSLLVVPASDVRHEKVTSARDAERLLAANLAVTGSVQPITNGIEVTMNLVDTRTVTQLRTETIKTGPDLAAVQDGVLEKVARMIELTLQPEAQRAMKAGESTASGAFRRYVEGRGYLERYDQPENIDSAIAAFESALAIDPNYARAQAGLAEAYWRRYDLRKDPASIDAALESCRRALQLNDGLAAVHVTMGMIEVGKGQYEQAEGEFTQALGIEPRSADAYRELAIAYEDSGKLEKAEATYKRAIELEADNWSSIKQLGVFYFNHGRYPEAEEYFREVIRLTPTSAKAYSNLGAAYLKDRRENDAIRELERSVAIEPTAIAYSNMGSAYYYEGRYADAAAQFRNAAELNPTDSRFWGNLADAYRWTPSLSAKAPQAFRHAIALIEGEIAVNPHDGQLHARIANYWAALGEREKAAASIREALRLAPADGYVQFSAAGVYEQDHRRDESLRAIKAALQAHYSLEEILHAPALQALRADPRFAQMGAPSTP